MQAFGRDWWFLIRLRLFKANKQTEPQTKIKVTLPPDPAETSTLKFAHRREQKLSITMHTVLHEMNGTKTVGQTTAHPDVE